MIDRTLSMARHGQEGETAGRPRVLILGGSAFQVPIIRYAKEQGAYVITCDYLPGNPGHVLADEYHNVSTTDRDAILQLARGLDVDAVLSFASEPALQTVSYVAEALGLPGPPLSAVVKLTDKGLFRSLLREAGLPVPMAVTVAKATPAADVPRLMKEHGVAIPCIVKPVDSSGSKGITVLDETLATLRAALEHAFAFSRSGECIIEQYIEGDQIHGDGYLEGGQLVFQYLGDHVFFTDGGCRVPISTRWPTRYGPEVVQNIATQVEAIASVSGYPKGLVNIEAPVCSTSTLSRSPTFPDYQTYRALPSAKRGNVPVSARKAGLSFASRYFPIHHVNKRSGSQSLLVVRDLHNPGVSEAPFHLRHSKLH